MDRIIKFLIKLSDKERNYLKTVIFPKIASLELKTLRVKQLKAKEQLFVVRYGKIRIVFKKENQKGKIVLIGLRKDVYEKLH